MKIGLLCSGYESMGLESISACLKKEGHKVSLFFDPALFCSFTADNPVLGRLFSYREILVRRLMISRFDLIGFSVVSDTYRWACDIAERIKRQMDVPIIFGGIHPTSVPNIVIRKDFIDYVCVGEGENAMVELADALEKRKDTTRIRNIWAKKEGKIIKNELRPLISDLDSIPFPDKELFYREYRGFKRIYSIMSGRGCSYECSFCHHSHFRSIYKNGGVYLRRRSVENIINELRHAKEKYRIKKICFFDDLFLSDMNWLREFSHKYSEEIKLPFVCAVHPVNVNQESVSLLDKAGCSAVGLGVQTVSQQLRRDVLHRYETNEQIEKAIKLFKATGILLYVDILIGLPGQDEKELLDIVRFMNKNRPDMVLSIWLKYYPRLEILEIAREKGILTAEDIRQIEESCDSAPFTGRMFNKQAGKLSSFVVVSSVLPSWLNEVIINRKLYRYFFPLSAFIYLRLVLSIITLYKRIFAGKRKYIFSPLNQVFYVFYFGSKKFLAQLPAGVSLRIGSNN